MSNWNAIRKKIDAKTLESHTWKSDLNNLHFVIDAAEELGLDHADADAATLSNLRTVIKVAKKAIAAEDRDRLSELFHLAATLTTGALRVDIGTHELEEVYFDVKIVDGTKVYLIYANNEQLERIMKSTKNHFQYTDIGKSK